jgi:predicted phage gp36 major capsid-like protein
MRKGGRGKYKGFVANYLAALDQSLEEVENEVRKQVDERRKAAEEAEKKIKRAPGSVVADPDHEVGAVVTVMDRREEILKNTHARAFGKWSKKDWVRFTRAWVGYAK